MRTHEQERARFKQFRKGFFRLTPLGGFIRPTRVWYDLCPMIQIRVRRWTVGSVLCLLIGCASCSKESSTPSKVSSPTATASAPDWDLFWKDFRSAVQNKNRAALRTLMPQHFDYSFGGGPQTPEAAFASWDTPEINGWDALIQATADGAVDYKPPPQWQLKGRVKISPPKASAADYTHWRAVFEQGPEGRWYFVSFLNGD